MYRLQRSAQAKGGKAQQATQVAKEAAEYINTKYAPVSVQVYTEFFGHPNTIYWCSEYKDLAPFEGIYAQLIADKGYAAIVAKGADVFIEGSVQDTLMASV